MSDYLPFELQVEIIKRLPVKPLLQFRSVSKRWKTLIGSSDFIAAYSFDHTQLNRLIVWYEEHVPLTQTGKKLVSILDDETLNSISAHHEIDPTALGLSKPFKDLRVVGSSQGLLCLYDFLQDPSCHYSGTLVVVLWNPSIRKSVDVVVPGVLDMMFEHTVLGFGVCPITSDPTIVKIINISKKMKQRDGVPFLVEVFTLSTGNWRVIPSSKLPNKPVEVTSYRVVIDKFIYWFVFDDIDDMFDVGAHKMIMSFDMTTQEFSLIDLPKSFAHLSSTYVSISKVRDSLVVLEYNPNSERQVCVVWMRSHGVPNLFTKMFSIITPFESINILGFKKSGGPIMEMLNEIWGPAALVFCEPYSEDCNCTSIFAKSGSIFVDSYKETLLLLDKDSSVYSINN
ncbi:hypothetical protein Lser_V15G12364 [Lactuca serriola]